MRRRAYLGMLAIAASAAALGGCVFGGGDDEREASATATPEVAAPARATSEATSAPAVATPTVTTTPEATSTATRSISGLFTEPRETTPDLDLALPVRPPSPFAPPDPDDVVLFDTRDGTEENLGPGVSKAFSPDGTRLAWTAGLPIDAGEVWVIDLESRERESFGPGQALHWVDDRTLYIQQRDSDEREFLDVDSGERSVAPGPDVVVPPFLRPVEAGGYRLQRIEQSEYPTWTSTYLLESLAGTELPIRFDAHRALLTPDGTLFVALTPDEPSGPDPNAGAHIETGLSNIFEVDPASGEASFVATALASAPGWPFVATESIVAWTDDACASDGEPAHRTSVYDRRSAELTTITPGVWPGDALGTRLGLYVFGIGAWLDVETLEYVSVLPDAIFFAAWSPDARYAATSFNFGSDGPCG